MRTVALALSAFAVLGCSSEPTATPIEPDRPAAERPGSASGSGAGVAPLTSGAAGPATPVVGAESVQGSGSGVGQAAKDKAREVASGGTSSLDTGE